MPELLDWILFARLALPVTLLIAVALMIVVAAPFLKQRGESIALFSSILATGAALFFAWQEWLAGASFSLQMIAFDRLAYGFDLLLLVALLLTLLLSWDGLKTRQGRSEASALLLLATAGLMLVAHAEDMIILFLGIEISSLAGYILAGLYRHSIRSHESSLKYFLLGSFASAFLLYGIALLYGMTGSTSLQFLSNASGSAAGTDLLLLASLAFLLIGLGFKIAAVPFHFWSPDVYEGAPTPITAFMASAIKAGGFAALLRILLAMNHLVDLPWVPLLETLAILTMTVGNLVALRQGNLKRMLAYSSIAHVGYLLVGVTAGMKGGADLEQSFGAVLFYLFAYSFMTIGAFAVLVALGQRPGRWDEPEEMTDYRGLASSRPVLAALLSIFLISLIGIPPTVGFIGKFYLFSSAIQAGLPGLVVVGVLNSLISVPYYLRPIRTIYFQEGDRFELRPTSYYLLIGLFVCLFGTLYLGIFPSELFLIARESVKGLVF